MKSALLTLQTGTGTANISVTGAGFQPKAAIFFGTRRGSAGLVSPNHFGIGFAVSATQRGCLTRGGRDNAATDVQKTDISSTRCFKLWDATSNILNGELDFVSFDADGFTVDPTVAFDADYAIQVLLLGGADLTDVAVGAFNIATAAGAASVTGVGFQPEFLMLLGANYDTTAVGNLAHGTGVISVVSAAGEEGMVAESATGAVATSDNRRLTTDSLMLRYPRRDADTIRFTCDFTSFDADGFTYNKTNVAGTSGPIMLYLALRGGDYKVKSFAAQTGAGQFAVTGVGFKPVAMLALSTFSGAADQSAITAGSKMSVGAAVSAAARGSVFALDPDAIGPNSDNAAGLSTTRLLQNYSRTEADTFAADGEIDLVSFDADGVTLDQVDPDPTAHLILGVFFGPPSGPEITLQPLDQAMVAGPAVPELKTVEVPIAYTLSGDLVGVRAEWFNDPAWEEIDDPAFSVVADAGSAVLTIDEPDRATWNGRTLRLVPEDENGETPTDSFGLTIYAGPTYDGDLATVAGEAAGTVESDVPCDVLAADFGIPGAYIELPLISGSSTLRGGATSIEPT